MIVQAIQHYYPEWQPPTDRGREWHLTRCPFHGDETPSAAVSFVHDAFVCHACGVKGSAASIIRKKEGPGGNTNQVTADILAGSDDPVREQPTRVTGRGVSGVAGPRFLGRKGDGKQVPSRVRRRFGEPT